MGPRPAGITPENAIQSYATTAIGGDMKKKWIAAAFAAVLTLSLTACTVVPIGHEDEYTGNKATDIGGNMQETWTEIETNIEEKAVDAPTFLVEANGDLTSLVDQYGKYSMGNNGTISYALTGNGTVTEVEDGKKAGYIVVDLDGYDGPEVVKLQIGSVYKGSSTRDTQDLLKYGDYVNQEEWAAVSQELHKIIDETVVAPADPANLQGKTIAFVGTFTADGNDELLITPVKLEVE